MDCNGLDFGKFTLHLVMPSLRYTIGIPLDFRKILVPYTLCLLSQPSSLLPLLFSPYCFLSFFIPFSSSPLFCILLQIYRVIWFLEVSISMPLILLLWEKSCSKLTFRRISLPLWGFWVTKCFQTFFLGKRKVLG